MLKTVLALWGIIVIMQKYLIELNEKYQFSSLGLETGNRNVWGISLYLFYPSCLKDKHYFLNYQPKKNQ